MFGNKIKETKGKKEQKRKRKGRYIIKDVVWWCCIETIYKNKRERSLLVIYFQLIPSSPLSHSVCPSVFLKNTREWKLVYKKLDWFARALSVNECKSKGIKKEETTSSNGHSLCCAWPLCRESEREKKRRSAIKERDFVVRVDERSSSLLESKGGTTLPSGIIVSPKSRRRSKKNHPNRRKKYTKKWRRSIIHYQRPVPIVASRL